MTMTKKLYSAKTAKKAILKIVKNTNIDLNNFFNTPMPVFEGETLEYMIETNPTEAVNCIYRIWEGTS